MESTQLTDESRQIEQFMETSQETLKTFLNEMPCVNNMEPAFNHAAALGVMFNSVTHALRSITYELAALRQVVQANNQLKSQHE